MNKIKEFFRNKKNVTICAIVLGVLVVAGAGIGISYSINSTGAKKASLENELKEMGKDFYENFYYDLVVKDHGTDQISKFNTVGIKVDLSNLERYKSDNKEKVEKFVNPKTNQSCNKDETKVVIYPEDPYGKTNYRLETILSCGFDEK